MSPPWMTLRVDVNRQTATLAGDCDVWKTPEIEASRAVGIRGKSGQPSHLSPPPVPSDGRQVHHQNVTKVTEKVTCDIIIITMVDARL